MIYTVRVGWFWFIFCLFSSFLSFSSTAFSQSYLRSEKVEISPKRRPNKWITKNKCWHLHFCKPQLSLEFAVFKCRPWTSCGLGSSCQAVRQVVKEASGSASKCKVTCSIVIREQHINNEWKKYIYLITIKTDDVFFWHKVLVCRAVPTHYS